MNVLYKGQIFGLIIHYALAYATDKLFGVESSSRVQI